MNKIVTLIIFICITVMFSSCSAPAVKTDTAAAPPDVNAGTAQTTGQSTVAEPEKPVGSGPATVGETAVSQSAAAEPEKPVDSGLTLESIKQAAIAAGYKAENGKVRPDLEPPPVASIMVNYEDEFMMAQAPVYEFKNAEDALAFAKDANESGYSRSIVNGKFLTLAAAKSGVIENDRELAVLEKLLQSKVMEYSEPIPAALVPSKAYNGAFKQLDTIRGVMNRMVNRAVLLYGKTLPNEKAQNITSLNFSLASSGDLSFTAPLSEDQAALDYVLKVWEKFGCTEFNIKHDTAHNYVLSGKRAGEDDKFAIACTYDPATGSLRLVEKDKSGAARDYIEYVPLGASKYAFAAIN